MYRKITLSFLSVLALSACKDEDVEEGLRDVSDRIMLQKVCNYDEELFPFGPPNIPGLGCTKTPSIRFPFPPSGSGGGSGGGGSQTNVYNGTVDIVSAMSMDTAVSTTQPSMTANLIFTITAKNAYGQLLEEREFSVHRTGSIFSVQSPSDVAYWIDNELSGVASVEASLSIDEFDEQVGTNVFVVQAKLAGVIVGSAGEIWFNDGCEPTYGYYFATQSMCLGG